MPATDTQAESQIGEPLCDFTPNRETISATFGIAFIEAVEQAVRDLLHEPQLAAQLRGFLPVPLELDDAFPGKPINAQELKSLRRRFRDRLAKYLGEKRKNVESVRIRTRPRLDLRFRLTLRENRGNVRIGPSDLELKLPPRQQRHLQQEEQFREPEGLSKVEMEIITAMRANHVLAELLCDVAAAANTTDAVHLTDAAEVQRGLNELNRLSQGNEDPDRAIPVLKDMYKILEGIRVAIGRRLSAVFNQWTGQSWDDEEMRQIASRIDESASALNLKFSVPEDSEGVSGSLRARLHSRLKAVVFQFTFVRNGRLTSSRYFRELPDLLPVPSPKDVRRRRLQE